ncbi:uncharacterized protein BO66DRAFT_217009 [Aspergillus aculeatinus CBS 121060]|uniref:Uncharacterized protein n=1 Tax=Aspergillus aculeatinus CBS 121060 TaxID=1448322 RepID=A0ACD1GV11_9EURO|nr:hypothetical protein BO66DRAFT_217009 [Aspergillus aculeatinus CBS 121060]RAH65198.1 hypothetical protein BO66DRAFT_217009 [Aspergillus aculeatinus CBS 121060]
MKASRRTITSGSSGRFKGPGCCLAVLLAIKTRSAGIPNISRPSEANRSKIDLGSDRANGSTDACQCGLETKCMCLVAQCSGNASPGLLSDSPQTLFLTRSTNSPHVKS